ncbi:MAG: ParB/RepB/Spo0J family partition protein [Candidatus Dormibacteraceae bacterium]
MTRARGLGRGLDALIPLSASGEAVPELVAVDQVRPSPEQSRRRFDAEALRELADSISAHGLLQPVLVRRMSDGYELIAGERRWRAAQMAGLTRMPAIVRATSPEQDESLILGLVENIQRQDLDAIEEARGIQRLIDHLGLTHEEAAGRLGKNRVSVSHALRLLNAPPSIQASVSAGALSAGHARALVGLPDLEAQELGLRVVLERHLSVRKTEAWVKSYRAPARHRQAGAGLKQLAQELEGALGLPVGIAGSARRGRVIVRFSSPEELGRLRDKLSS